MGGGHLAGACGVTEAMWPVLSGRLVILLLSHCAQQQVPVCRTVLASHSGAGAGRASLAIRKGFSFMPREHLGPPSPESETSTRTGHTPGWQEEVDLYSQEPWAAAAPQLRAGESPLDGLVVLNTMSGPWIGRLQATPNLELPGQTDGSLRETQCRWHQGTRAQDIVSRWESGQQCPRAFPVLPSARGGVGKWVGKPCALTGLSCHTF